MATILDTIAVYAAKRVKAAKAQVPLEEIKKQALRKESLSYGAEDGT